jgi:SNF2 family DNA or RNA helicase
LGCGSIIADDMGLGKTLQVIAVILKLKREGALSRQGVLVVVPTTLLSNWQKELEKFAPELSYSFYHGPTRELNTKTDVVISSYGVVRSDIDQLSKVKWQAVVIDEAQNIKNPDAAQTRAVKKLKSDIRLAMSGTPVENRLSEYWSIFDFINKGYLGSRKKFSENFARPIEQNRDKTKLKHFLKITGPFILRRMKTDKSIIDDLPEKVENDFFASLTKEQAAIYQNVLDNIMREISGVDVNQGDGKIQRKGLVLKLIMALKQICNHPSQYLKKNDYSADLSGKAGVFLNLVNNIIENDDKVLVFTQFREMGIILQHLIKDKFDMNAMFLHGGTTRKQRDEMVEKFQNNPPEKVFILSIKAAGTGLNLTSANHVIHYDLWWNPAVESQATDRAFRIGQDKNVMVYRLITQGTFEEKINKMLTNKKELANLTVTAGEKWVGDLSDNELKQLFTLSE